MKNLKNVLRRSKNLTFKILNRTFLKVIKKLRKKYPKIKKLVVELVNILRIWGLYRLGSRKMSRFKGDLILNSMIDEIIKIFKPTSFIETGTYQGGTSLNMAKLHPKLPILTCEVNKKFYKIARQELKEYINVRIENISSEIFLKKLFENIGEKRKLFNLPIIFLDAHWYDFWPLQNEINIISSILNKVIIVIHDFKVPNKPEFNYYVYKNFDGNFTPCNFSLIENELNNEKKYSFLYPNYNTEQAKISSLKGYVIIFQNLTETFNKFIKNEFVKNNFFEYKLDSIQ